MWARRRYKLHCTLALASLLPALAQATGLALHCRAPSPDASQLICDYQAPAGEQALPEARTPTGLPLTVSSLRALNTAEDPIAILVMVDVSDPGRKADVARSQTLALAIAELYPENVGIGLAEFASELTIKAPLDSSRAEFDAARLGLEAVGLTTELYRSILQGIEVLGAQTKATRRWLIVLSDGLAEDVAYSHADVIGAAQEHGVLIHALGLPRSRAKAVALARLRRLAEETGGGYVEIGPNPPDLASILPAADAGMRLGVDVSAIPPGSGRQELQFTLNRGTVIHQASVAYQAPPAVVIEATPNVTGVAVEDIKAAVRAALPPPPPPAAVPTPAVTRPPALPAVVATPLNNSRDTQLLLWLGAGGSVGGLIAIIGLIWYLRRRLNPAAIVAQNPTGASGAPPSSPVAFLVARDGDARHAVWRLPCRIGRAANNEVVLDDASVSRHHAEIERRPDGGFSITDLDSLNGVFIEGKRVANSRIFEGVQLDIGDLAFRFTLIDPDDSDQHATVMIRTEAPTTVGTPNTAFHQR